MMTSRQRLFKVLSGGIPDRVPASPDISNMIPAKLTGKPWWDIYLYNDPPIWEAYIRAAEYYGIDALMDGYFPFAFPWEEAEIENFDTANPRYVVGESESSIITRRRGPDGAWHPTVDVYWRNQTPAMNVRPADVGLPEEPRDYRPLTGVKPVERGLAGLRRTKELLGDRGLLGIFVIGSCVINTPERLYDYFDHPEKLTELRCKRMDAVERKMAFLKTLPPDCRPDFLCFGGSGSLILQDINFIAENLLPAIRRGIEPAAEYGYFSHIHSCGPESALVKLMAENTVLTVIDPLEIPPMGDCDLATLKRLYGNKLVLKGNLHTTDVMLRGTPETVTAAARRAIEAAAAGGGFILSTGDQCGRDTPPENLRALVEAAETHGRYNG
ncbi:MAG: uroporphyrinogen decarboxylase family protein [Victivallaceae bacterium]